MRLVGLAVLGSTVALALGFLGNIHPGFDTLSHGRFHLSVCILLGAAFLVFSRWRKAGIVALSAGMLGLYASSAIFPATAPVQEPINGKPVYTLYHLNLLWNHSDPAPVIDEILSHDPELISISEASLEWEPHLERLDSKWPNMFTCPEFGPRGGVRIYSKWEMVGNEDYCGVYGSLGKTTVKVPNEGELQVVSLHFRWPWPASGPEQLQSALPELRSLGADVLVAGDFNATPWSNSARQFAAAGGLELVPGIGPTWLFTEFKPEFIGWIGFPIDNVAYKGRVRLLQAKSLPPVGSDHLPILVKFQID